MEYIVLDLEWNQSADEAGENEALHFEVIEIGAVKLNQERQIIDTFSQLIRPQVYPQLHKITSHLIHLQSHELDQGRTFPEVAREFLDWCGKDFIFCSWGLQDLTELQSNMAYYEMEPLSDGPIRFLDVQKLFSLAFEDGKVRRSLEHAVDFLQIEKDIPFHRALEDARYTGKVFAAIGDEKILERYSFDLFHPPRSREQEIKVTFDTYEKYISRVFRDKQEAFGDREVVSTKCYLCHRNIKKKVKWFCPKGKHYYCLAYCEKHGYLKGKMRIKRAENGGIYVVKTTKLISEQEAEQIRQRKET
ncbi:MAG: exonuclease domain-containing protein [Lachnospiraceae bacterium]|nr:exonuclease domain-containing protein [Lachnospiraceae bacterium]